MPLRRNDKGNVPEDFFGVTVSILFNIHTVTLVESRKYKIDGFLCPLDINFLWDLNYAMGGGWVFESRSKNCKFIQFRKYVGLVRLPSGTTLHVLPKLVSEELDEENLQRYHNHFFSYIRACNAVPAVKKFGSGLTGFRDFLELHINLICKVGMDLFKEGVFGRFSREISLVTPISGKIDYSAQIKKRPFLHDKHYCLINLIAKNHAVSVFIKSILTKCLSIAKDARNQEKLKHILSLLVDIPLPPVSSKLSRPSLTKTEKRWDSFISLLDQFQNHYFSGLTGGGKAVGEYWLFEVEKLFEKFVYRFLSRSNLFNKILVKPSKNICVDSQGTGCFPVYPDFVASTKEHNFIIDAKWKIISSEEMSDVSIDDIRQIIIYLDLFKCQFGVLVFPTIDDTASYQDFYCHESINRTIRIALLPINSMSLSSDAKLSRTIEVFFSAGPGVNDRSPTLPISDLIPTK